MQTFLIRRPSEHELRTCVHVHLTGDLPWNPEEGSRNLVLMKTSYTRITTINCRSKGEMRSPVIGMAELSAMEMACVVGF